jgi:hypothetical protein
MVSDQGIGTPWRFQAQGDSRAHDEASHDEQTRRRVQHCRPQEQEGFCCSGSLYLYNK